MKTLSELLAEADEHFNHKITSGCYQYTLGRFPSGWTFNVVNSWHNWLAANRQYTFGPCATPEQAVAEFLAFVKQNRIMVAQLQG